MPQPNSVAKIMNITLIEKARNMLTDEGLSQDYLEKEVGTTYYLVNTSSMSSLVNKNSYEA